MAYTPTPAPMPGSPYASQGSINAGKNSGFWGSIKNKLSNMGATTSSSGGGSSSSGGGGGIMGDSVTGNPLGDAALSMGTIGLGGVIGGLSGDDESGDDKYMSQRAHSEGVTRKFEAKNTVPSTALGNYMARALALQGMPVLGALNNIDFFSKVMGYTKDYYPKLSRKGNKGLLNVTQNIGNLLKGRR